jgi:MazG family protein
MARRTTRSTTTTSTPARATARRSTRERRSAAARARRAGTAFARLVRLMAALRSPRGCPWDRQQTHETLRPFLVEETYEAIDAIDRGDLDALAGELGDVLFQCVFHAQLAAEAGRFDIADAVAAITDKLVRRHPHVFTSSGRPLPGGAARSRRVRTPDQVVEQWEALKAREQSARGESRRLLSGVPRAMPALVRAHEIGTRVAAVGFDWPDAAAVLEKVDEELAELREALPDAKDRAEDELGDLLFTIANLARRLEIDAEAALRRANDKFSARFDRVEATLEAAGRSVHDATPSELESAWQRVKRGER